MSEQHPSGDPSSYRGRLEEQPLPEVLMTIHRYRAPGILDCADRNGSRTIYVDDGSVVAVTSTLPADSIAQRLFNEGKITAEQLKTLPESSDESFDLVDAGLLQPRQLFQAERSRAIAILSSIAEQPEGTIRFCPGREELGAAKYNLKIPQMVLELLREVQDARRYLARVGSRHTQLAKVIEAPSDVAFNSHEMNLLAQIDGKKTIAELASMPPMTATQNALALYSFHVLHLIEPTTSRPIKVQIKTPGDAHQ